MSLYFKYLKLHFKSVIQYKVSFILSLISQIFVFFSYYFMIIALFTKFDNIKGFTLYEILLCFAVIQLSFSMVELFARGIDKFDKLIVDGSFDRILVRPRNIILQVTGYQMDYVKIARVIQAIIVLVIALLKLNLDWSILKIICLSLMIISGIALFFGIFTLSASFSFVTIQGLEVKNVITYGGKQIAEYPIGIFKKGVVFILTFIIPFAFVNYYPLLYLLGRNNNWLYAISPLAVFIFLVPCILVFYLGVRKYSSAGS